MPDLKHTSVMYLKGVGPARAKLLQSELGITTYHDLLYNFPFRYIDRSVIHQVNEIGPQLEGVDVQFRGRFVTLTLAGEGRRIRLQGLFSDGTGTLEVVWFRNVHRLKDFYQTGVEYLLFGRPTVFSNHYNIVHPEVDKVVPGATQPQGLLGVYSLTEKMRKRNFTSRALQKIVATMMASVAVRSLPETLPAEVMARYKLMPLGEALVSMHTPATLADAQRAQLRFKFEELFFLQLNIIRYIKGDSRRLKGLPMPHVGEWFNRFYKEELQFPLTGAQKRVIKEMREDMRSGRQMNRLLQGDVGSGKTIVAFMSMLIAIGNGYQACLMAPTEILASQHLETLQPLADSIGVRVALLTGSTRKRRRDEIHRQLLSGELNILIGTHALIEDTVQFRNLGLAVIDEQHRFGVAQRARLWKKNDHAAPHVLVMTATPIPRTLAMTVYGDLDVSVIDELPPGRKPVTTVIRYQNQHNEVYRFVGKQIAEGRQAYFVYPLIEENEKFEWRALEEGYDIIRETFPQYRVAYVHGRLKPEEKDYQMGLFASGQAQILVATTVIEVGVNVPNASVMVIENAERFGLSQLHQLRGRVGRGADKSYCVLMTKYELSSDTRHRLKVMTDTNDGFVVAEEDMKLRGPGDMEGTQQSGVAFNLKVANLARDGQVVQMARDAATDFLAHDPDLSSPEGQRMDARLHEIFNKQVDWGRIS